MNVDGISGYYRCLEYLVFGSALQRRRLEYLDELESARSTLLLGDGDGRFLAAFCERNQTSKVHYVDSSRKMLSLAQRRLRKSLGQGSDRVHFQNADARSCVLPPSSYDLIATHFFLDCFNEEDCSRLITTASLAATPRAQWLISEFRIPGHGAARLWASFWIRASYFFFRIATGLQTNTLPDYSPALTANGFRLVEQRISGSGMLVSELWERNGFLFEGGKNNTNPNPASPTVDGSVTAG